MIAPGPDSLHGRTAIVAGSTRGIGLGIARALGGAGARVVISGEDVGMPERVAASLRANGKDGYAIDGDTSITDDS